MADKVTAKLYWNTRVPKLEHTESVLQECTDAGWLVHTITQPFLFDGHLYVMIVLHRAVMIKGEAAEELLAAREGNLTPSPSSGKLGS